MSREEAIDLLDNLIGMVEDNQESDYDTALKMGIQALSQEPCDDTVSRQAVLDEINRIGIKAFETYTDYSQLYDFVDTLPSVTQESDEQLYKNGFADGYEQGHKDAEQKSGKWIRWREEVQRGTHYTENIPHCKCSECGKEYDIFASRFINYCPNCGCRMVEPQESE